jgi:hypothetical protein
MIRIGIAFEIVGTVATSFIAGGLHCADDNVERAQTGNLLLRRSANTFTQGQQPDDARHTNEDAQDRQRRSQRMHPQAADTELERSSPNGEHCCYAS